MPRSVQVQFARRALAPLLAAGLLFCAAVLHGQAPSGQSTERTSSPKNDTAVQAPQSQAASQTPSSQSPAPPAAPLTNTAEVSTRDTPPTFKVRVNLVLVRVVVRDQQGNVVPDLKKEDFQLFDNRKPQVISSFNVETPETHAVVPTAAASPPASDTSEAAPGTPTALPQRFVALVFDDTDMLATDAVFVRDAASHFLGSLAPSDRVGMYSTSGQLTQEFTSDRDVLKDALLRVVPRPVAGHQGGFHECPDLGYYQADQIVNFRNDQALAVATEDAIQCAFQGDQTQRVAAQSLAQGVADHVANAFDSQTEYVYRHLEEHIRRLAGMPGQRVMVFVSPGFLLTKYTREGSDLVDRANRAGIVINTIDARGLYTPDMGDLSDPPVDTYRTAGYKSSYRIAEQLAQAEILGQLADGTGGTFFHNRNDVDRGLREAVVAPPLSYLLAFAPQNLKIDGRYHTLKVSLSGKQKFSVQARHGYYAPRTIVDPAEAAKEEIQEALFSQEEIHDLPVELQTQFFKADQTQARLAVLTHVDLKGLHFRKADGRNRDDLTLATAIFDENGNYVMGGEGVVEMRLLDPTFAHLSRSGFTVKSSFDVKPGTYLVRLVVRDAEGAQMAARNGAVVIPY
jgi:VWFA-related protein